MMGNRECQFTEEVKGMIKAYVDGYARRVGNRSTATWGEDFNVVFKRAAQYAPLIIRSFNQEGLQPAVGLYVAMIESEYRPHCYDNFAGAMGMFQFLAGTARGYGLSPSDRCDPQKMAPAAARYMKDRISEFGTDATSVALAIAGYNRSPASVRRDLHDVINSENPERSFWTLVANSGQLDHYFQENMKYVPKFFAAAIVCENPEAFGLSFRPLSSYTRETDQPQ
jgi:membrane-bound lytic murein transglycosylase D